VPATTRPRNRRASAAGAGPGRRRRLAVAALGLVGLLGACSTAASSPARTGARPADGPTAARTAAFTGAGWIAQLERQDAKAPGYLQPGSNPSVLPGPIMIADRNNNRLLIISPKGQILWQFPADGHLSAGQTFISPDDAFFGPHGNHIIVTQEDDFAITVLALPSGTISYRYGHPGVPGSGPGYVDNPDDAMILPNGDILSADIKNCRIIIVPEGASAPSQIFGETTHYCYHNPPARFGSPNGVFPMTNGDYLVTEINGDWVDEMSLAGQVMWSTHPPGFTYPSDSNEVSPGVLLSVNYAKPGAVETFSPQGQLLWRYAPTGSAALNQPSIALPLPNGDILMTDDWNHRVIVVDPHTNQVVWQYGHTGVPGTAPGYLDKPDGVDLAPPYSLLMTHAATMGLPPGTSGTAPAGGSAAVAGGTPSAPSSSGRATKAAGRRRP